ncbi:hypothetical protein [uncultured Thermosynechococcus sp.]|uniref:hypothetical protein n=1 Tax=uncultured Thermosynechococcus sp. TaxID=436945 RepID=UPI00262A3208|nr:hypothetical protein [uncultured Thermosynechococcus sp.]
MTTLLAPAVTYLTPEAYLAQEVVATERHEYRQGELYTLHGGSVNHNELVRSLTVLLSLALKEQPYRVTCNPNSPNPNPVSVKCPSPLPLLMSPSTLA